MARFTRASASLRSGSEPRATVPRPRIETLTPVLPRGRCGSFAASFPARAAAPPRSRAVPATPEWTNSRREGRDGDRMEVSREGERARRGCRYTGSILHGQDCGRHEALAAWTGGLRPPTLAPPRTGGENQRTPVPRRPP